MNNVLWTVNALKYYLGFTEKEDWDNRSIETKTETATVHREELPINYMTQFILPNGSEIISNCDTTSNYRNHLAFNSGDQVQITYQMLKVPLTDFFPPNFTERKQIFHGVNYTIKNVEKLN